MAGRKTTTATKSKATGLGAYMSPSVLKQRDRPKPHRPSSFTPAIKAKLLRARRQGLNNTRCAAYAEVLLDRMDKWLKQGEVEWIDYQEGCRTTKTALADLYAKWHSIRQEAVIKALEDLSEGGATIGASRVAWLEKAEPEEYGKRAHLNIEKKETKVVYEIQVLGGDAWRMRALAEKSDIADPTHLLPGVNEVTAIETHFEAEESAGDEDRADSDDSDDYTFDTPISFHDPGVVKAAKMRARK